MGATASKSDRVSLRIDPHTKETLERAARYAGSTLSEFVITRALAAACDTIRAQESIVLSNRDFDAFLDALAHPPKLGARLRKALRRHDALYGPE